MFIILFLTGWLFLAIGAAVLWITFNEDVEVTTSSRGSNDIDQTTISRIFSMVIALIAFYFAGHMLAAAFR